MGWDYFYLSVNNDLRFYIPIKLHKKRFSNDKVLSLFFRYFQCSFLLSVSHVCISNMLYIFQVIVMLVAILVVFAVCWLPFQIILLYSELRSNREAVSFIIKTCFVKIYSNFFFWWEGLEFLQPFSGKGLKFFLKFCMHYIWNEKQPKKVQTKYALFR